MGQLDGWGRCMKYSLILSNFIILIGGIVLIIIGAISLYDQTVFQDLIDDSLYQAASFVVLGSGICLTLFAFLGCYGGWKEIKCFLLMYIIVLLIFCVILLIGGLLAFVFIGSGEYVETRLKDTMDDQTKREAWDVVQSTFECCGVTTYKDWHLLLRINPQTIDEVPASCCRSRSPEYSCSRNPTGLNTWDIGCLTKFRNGAHVVGSIGITVACFTIVGLLLSLGLFRSIQ